MDLASHSDFAGSGDDLLTQLVELGGLQPGHAVLDVGCGAGRIARPLSRYLDPGGSYDGFDVDRAGIGWCRRRYARHPNFHFRVADVYHRRFNPHGAHAAAEYRFPYEDESFEFVILTGVLTHLLENEADHYLAEAARVLSPGGRVLATLFLLDDASRAAIADGRAGLDFLDPDAHVAVLSEELPEEAVAYDADWIGERLGDHGLSAVSTTPGTWSGREDAPILQDIVVAEKAA